MFLVDTNVVSEARRQTPEAVRWLRSVDPRHLYLSVITLGEISRGMTAKNRTHRRAAEVLGRWLETLRADYDDRVLPVTDDIALEWGRLSAQRPRGSADGLLAATAIIHGLTVVTRNTADFVDTSAPVVNPWALAL